MRFDIVDLRRADAVAATSGIGSAGIALHIKRAFTAGADSGGARVMGRAPPNRERSDP